MYIPSNQQKFNDQFYKQQQQNQLDIMIDGKYPSQFAEVQAMRSSHYRNLQRIFNKSTTSKISFMSPDFMYMTRRKKFNHENWRSFNNKKQEQQRFKNNANIYNRLQKISSSKSRYAINTQPSSNSKDPLLHHNYLYECHRRYQKIEKSNSMIASRLLNTRGEYNHQKLENEFQTNKLNVSRLQKFDRLKRLNRLVNKSMNQKFRKTKSSRIFSYNNESNPQNQ